MYWLFKFSSVVEVLVRLGAISEREDVVGNDSSYLNLSKYWGWGGRSTRELISVYDLPSFIFLLFS
jgi:hypothetical protein